MPSVDFVLVEKIGGIKPSKAATDVFDPFSIGHRRGDDDVVECFVVLAVLMAPSGCEGKLIPEVVAVSVIGFEHLIRNRRNNFV